MTETPDLTEVPDPTWAFEARRALLVNAAYRILGTYSDAVDVVQ